MGLKGSRNRGDAVTCILEPFNLGKIAHGFIHRDRG